MNWISILYRFIRPHTVIATAMQVSGLFVAVGGIRDLPPASVLTWLGALLASLAANIYIVGLNQLADVDIDRVNKPTLPLASGELSLKAGRSIILGAGLFALVASFLQGSILLATILVSVLIGSAYSLPPLHLKSKPLLAALSIAVTRGFVANFGITLHFYQDLRPLENPPWVSLLAISVFFFGFGLVIALFKDIPDLVGDRQYDIRTFTVRLGQERVFSAGRLILTAVYLVPILFGIILLPAVEGIVLVLSHVLLAGLFWWRSFSVDVHEPDQVTGYYMFLWSLFYVEYIILALASAFAETVFS